MSRDYDDPSFVSVVTINNQRGEDATIYVMHAGIRGRRLGTVQSYGTVSFMLRDPDTPLASDLQFLARADVTGVTELSDAIPAERGAIYEWKLGPGRGYGFLSLSHAGC